MSRWGRLGSGPGGCRRVERVNVHTNHKESLSAAPCVAHITALNVISSPSWAVKHMQVKEKGSLTEQLNLRDSK